MNTSSEPRRCPACSAEIPAEAPQGLCPKCLLLGVASVAEPPENLRASAVGGISQSGARSQGRAMNDSRPASPSIEELAAAPEVLAEVKRAVQMANKQLAQYEQIRKHTVLPREFTIENGEMTPTTKVRRKKVLENFKEQIAAMYSSKEDL